MKWVLKCLRNYANFTGRASRSEFWWFVLFGVIAGLVGTDMASIRWCPMAIERFQ